jgi:hypothetical protein
MKSLFAAIVALVFALIAMAMLIFAPTTQIRKGRYGPPASLLQLIQLVFNFTYAFFVAAIKNYQYLVLFGISSLLAIVWHSSSGRSAKSLNTFLLASGMFVLAAIFVAASFTPSAYIEKGIPAARTFIIPRFILVSAFVAAGWFIGITLRELFKTRWIEPAALALLLIAYLYPIHSLNITAQKIAVYSQRTELWDIRNQVILTAIQNGEERVDTVAIDGLPVGGIRDFDPPDKKGFWITKCAMDYYGIRFRVQLP